MAKKLKASSPKSPKKKKEIRADLFPMDITPDQINVKLHEYLGSLESWGEIQIMEHVTVQKLPPQKEGDIQCLGLKILPVDEKNKPLQNRAICFMADVEWWNQILAVIQSPLFSPLLDTLLVMNRKSIEFNHARHPKKAPKEPKGQKAAIKTES